jgi:leader peptidase (prepilin peptidase) / N-methyltransferase
VVAAAGLLLGAIVGSFLATILIRWPQGQSVLRGRSRCDHCGKPLRALDLVPILSFALARGRCRQCGGAIDRRHLLIEAAAAAIGLVSVLAHPGLPGLATAVFGWWLLILAALDGEHHWLPNSLTLPLVPAGLAVALLGIGPPLADRLAGAAAGFLSFALIRFGYRLLRGREGLGRGDVKLMAGLGAWLGWQPLPLLLVGAGMLGLAAIVLLRLRGEPVSATTRLPLGTFLALAAWPLWLVNVS